MLKDLQNASSHEVLSVRSTWWVRCCRVLWKVIALLGAVLVLDPGANIVGTWFTNSKGVIPADSPIGVILAWWPISLLVGCCCLLAALLIWLLSRWPVHETISLSEQNRTRMLQRLRHTYRDLLAQLLQGTTWKEPRLTQKPDAVHTAVHLLLHSPNQPEHGLPPGTSIQQVYAEAQGELLILGEPKTGKSTLLLSLALHLVEQAEADATQPLPVILLLSSWAVKQQSLEDWCIKQIAEIYNVPWQMCEQWIQHDQIILLLDDLNKVDEALRPACIASINAYHHRHLMPLVVCARCAEYEDASKAQCLTLQTAVMVQPLAKENLSSY
ncbi:MAG TPA: hypothetical protein VFB12_03565 [Ktedonobacteraceae bacterium]|nr:hypothetical protein [Ktedonobacteraceae bacterium]